VICEPNTRPAVDSVDMVHELAARAEAESPARIYFKAAMTLGRKGEQPTDVAALAAEPRVVALSDDGDPLVTCPVAAEVCRLAAQADIMLTPHCEDSPQALQQMQDGIDPGFVPGDPYTNETQYIARDIALAAQHGCRMHFSHVSLASSAGVITSARAGGARVSWEVTPHHLLLCRSDYAEGKVPKVCPPLRTAADRDAMQDMLVQGAVDAVGSDHAPHTAADKAAGASGLIGLETTLGLMLARFVLPGRLTNTAAVQLMSRGPANLFGLNAGTLREGSPADMVLIDPTAQWRVDPETFRSLSRNCPYAGWDLRGRAVATFVAGERVFCTQQHRGRETP
jgi:dihydroorotase